jgi:hypothetical protein
MYDAEERKRDAKGSAVALRKIRCNAARVETVF